MAEKTVVISVPPGKSIKIVKWKVRKDVFVSIGNIILLFNEESENVRELRKFKATEAGTVKTLAAKEGEIVQPGCPLLELAACSHPTVMKDMCAECGADLRCDDKPLHNASVPMIHTVPELKVSEELAQKLGKEDSDRLLKDRKLVLLVDLDQTLIHTTNDNIPANIKDVHHFQLRGWAGGGGRWYHARLRPGTAAFLKAVAPHYELHICTFGARNYAHRVAQILDPKQLLFCNRILSRDECFDIHTKTPNLRALFPCGDNLVCIIDDREDVWNRATNLIQVKPYHFFEHTGDINAPPGLEKMERDIEGQGVHLKALNTKDDEATSPVKNGSTEEMPLLDGNTDADLQSPNLNNINSDKSLQLENKVVSAEVPLDESKVVLQEEKTDITENSVSNDISAESLEINKYPQEVSIVDESNEKDVSQNIDPQEELAKEIEEITSLEENAMVPEIEKIDTINPTSDSNSMIVDEEMKEITEKTNVTPVNTESNSSAGDTVNKDITEEPKKLDIDPEENNVNKQPENLRWKKLEDGMIEVEDSDDYLLYLEEILKRIHKFFYEVYDAMEAGSVPDLKSVIPQVKSQVLAGTSLVFSGLVPSNQKLEHSRAYMVARSLGAEVTQDFTKNTTHLVAVRPGTAKVHACRRVSSNTSNTPHTVTPAWLWACAERWQHCEELMFPLRGGPGRPRRRPPAHCASPPRAPPGPPPRKRTPSGRFMDTINPLLSFSQDDIADMDREVEDIINESGESDSDTDITAALKKEFGVPTAGDPFDIENEDPSTTLQGNPENISGSSDSEPESLSGGEHPHGWKPGRLRKRRRSSSVSLNDSDAGSSPKVNREDSGGDSTLDEFPSVRFRRGQDLPSDAPDQNESDTDGSVEPPDEIDDGEWNMMGAALEREFLGLDK